MLLILSVFFSASLCAESKLLFVHSDHLGTPQVLTDENQTVVWQVESQTPFGEVDINEDPDGDGQLVELNTRFPGQYFDEETGMNYNYYRTYDPSLGRYIQSDPIGILRDYSDPALKVAIQVGVVEETGFANESLNHLYGYVGQNPVGWYDPYGLAKKGGGGKGERGFTGKASGSKNPFKHYKPHPTDPNKVIYKHPQTGKNIIKPKPAGFPGPKVPWAVPIIIWDIIQNQCIYGGPMANNPFACPQPQGPQC
ncbi:RHS repeat domain-containing protein [Agaribacterium sp. ZY112]|uniref:RHS repeat domain-containing protein n=1 Tax=Agaribacterium sp. ZY112 TaxID=3233574 RepID=UPI0035262545